MTSRHRPSRGSGQIGVSGANVTAVQPLVHHLHVVDEADEHVGFELRDLVEVERGEQAMPPAEGGVRVQDHIPVLLGGHRRRDHILERRASQGGEPRDGEVEDAPRPHIRRLGVHQVAEVEELDMLAP